VVLSRLSPKLECTIQWAGLHCNEGKGEGLYSATKARRHEEKNYIIKNLVTWCLCGRAFTGKGLYIELKKRYDLSAHSHRARAGCQPGLCFIGTEVAFCNQIKLGMGCGLINSSCRYLVTCSSTGAVFCTPLEEIILLVFILVTIFTI